MPAPVEVLAFTFTAPGLRVDVYATEAIGGVSFRFDTTLSGNYKADLNGFFVDVGSNGGPLQSVGSSSNNMNGGNNDGYDYGVALGAVGGRELLDFRDGTAFIADITMNDLIGADAGLRVTSYGDGNREGSLKLVDTSDAAPAIDVQKEVRVGDSWVDADEATGPYLLNAPVDFRFVVTNTGNVELTNITLDDSDFDLNGVADGDTTTIPSLAAGASTTIPLDDMPWAMGQHTNTATVSTTYLGQAVSDTDDANYFGAKPEINIDKVTAGTGPGMVQVEGDGLSLITGSPVSWIYTVTNPGNVPLVVVSVSDNKGVTPVRDEALSTGEEDDTLDPGDSWVYLAGPLPAQSGLYENVGDVFAVSVVGVVSDSDGSSYTGLPPA